MSGYEAGSSTKPAPKRFEGKVFLVTGAGSGIGEVVAKKLAAAGAHVVLASRRVEKLEEVKKAIEADGGSASIEQVDVLKYEDVEKAVNSIVDKMGHLDGAFNNAGGGGTNGTIVDLPEAEFKKVFELNFYGTYHCIKAELQAMIKQKSGSIVNNISLLAELQWVGQTPHYGASKAALKYVQDAAALEAVGSGVRVNSVSPGFCRPSEALDAFIASVPEIEPLLAKSSPMNKVATAEDVYHSVAFLLDDQTSASITGHDLAVSGGSRIGQLKLG